MPSKPLSVYGLNAEDMLSELEELEAIIHSTSSPEGDLPDVSSSALVRFVHGVSEEQLAEFLRAHELEERWMAFALGEKFSSLERFSSLLERLIEDRNRDFLTGLGNRRYFERALSRELELAFEFRVPLTLVILDVDDFKEINDTYGHSAGDEALKYLSEVLDRETRATDVAARIGGEEFALILSGSGLRRSETIIDRIRTNISQNAVKDPHTQAEINITVSMGAAAYRGIGWLDRDTFFQEADKVVYKAKSNGKNRVESTVVVGLKSEETAVVGREEKRFLFSG